MVCSDLTRRGASDSPMQMTDSVLILGHTGFIGGRICQELSSCRERSVIGLSSREIDLSNEASIAGLASICGPTTTLIVCSGIKRQFGDTIDIFHRNLQMIGNLSRFLALNPIAHLIFISSAAVYGENNHNTIIRESTSIDPQTYYGLGKYSSERLLEISLDRQNIDTPFAILRLPLIYGEGDSSNGYGPADFVSRIASGKPIDLWGDGRELREFVFVDDVARLVKEVIRIRFNGILNVASGMSFSYRDIINTLSDIIYAPIPTEFRERTRPRVDHIFDPSRLFTFFPDFKFSLLKDGLSAMLEVQK